MTQLLSLLKLPAEIRQEIVALPKQARQRLTEHRLSLTSFRSVCPTSAFSRAILGARWKALLGAALLRVSGILTRHRADARSLPAEGGIC